MTLIENKSSDAEIVRFLSDVALGSPRDAELAAKLAVVLADSGSRFCRPNAATADVASTGGPSSLSTLLCPLFLRVGGLEVPKLGVPGRPAGGIDCLAQIAGYKTTLNDDELHVAMGRAGYAHFLSSGRFAPLDARVFKLRQEHGFQEVPTLVAASLLSKKIAVGLTTACLDVRVAHHGNFGRTMAEAEENATMFARAAALVGIAGRPVLTDGSTPYQPYVGRKEALAALADVFSSTADSWLQEHVETCRRLSIAAAPADRAPLIQAAEAGDLRHAFMENVAAQGAEEEAFSEAVRKARGGARLEILADGDGRVSVSLEAVRRCLVAAQATGPNKDVAFPDPAGVILLKRPGDVVLKGEALATVRVDVDSMVGRLKQDLCAAISVGGDSREART